MQALCSRCCGAVFQEKGEQSEQQKRPGGHRRGLTGQKEIRAISKVKKTCHGKWCADGHIGMFALQ